MFQHFQQSLVWASNHVNNLSNHNESRNANYLPGAIFSRPAGVRHRRGRETPVLPHHRSGVGALRRPDLDAAAQAAAGLPGGTAVPAEPTTAPQHSAGRRIGSIGSVAEQRQGAEHGGKVGIGLAAPQGGGRWNLELGGEDALTF